MKCPRCSAVLFRVEHDGVQINVCPGCKGEWLPAGDLQKIVEHHDEVFTPEEIASLAPVNQEILTAENDNHDELNCPNCQGEPMQHFNYGGTSGIILHKCPVCGGIWTDKDQLAKIEAVVDGKLILIRTRTSMIRSCKKLTPRNRRNWIRRFPFPDLASSMPF